MTTTATNKEFRTINQLGLDLEFTTVQLRTK